MLIMNEISVVMVILIAFCGIASAGSLFDKILQRAAPEIRLALSEDTICAVDPNLTLDASFNQMLLSKAPSNRAERGEVNNNGAEMGGPLGFNYQLRQTVLGLEDSRCAQSSCSPTHQYCWLAFPHSAG